MVESGELLVNYGAFPADPALQQAFFDTVQKDYPDSKIDWTVPQAMLGYVDKPNHQAWMPNYQKSRTALKALYNKYRTTAGARHRRRAQHAEDDPPGHLRRVLRLQSVVVSLGVPGGSPARDTTSPVLPRLHRSRTPP